MLITAVAIRSPGTVRRWVRSTDGSRSSPAPGGASAASTPLLFAAEGAKVVVNDLGAAPTARARRGAAEPSSRDRARAARPSPTATTAPTGTAAERLVAAAVEAFGRLDVLVNNAGILRDRAIVNMTEDEWDDVVRVHLKGHFVPTRWAADALAGASTRRAGRVAASIVHTSSTSGLFGNPGQTNYGAAKAGIAAFSTICAQELARYGVRSNCIAPGGPHPAHRGHARARRHVAAARRRALRRVGPGQRSPLVAYLATADCPFTGATFFVPGRHRAGSSSRGRFGDGRRAGRTAGRSPSSAPQLWPRWRDERSSECLTTRRHGRSSPAAGDGRRPRRRRPRS